MNDKIDVFDKAWRNNYVKLLTLKKDFLEEIIDGLTKNHDVSKQMLNLELVNYQLELCMVDHAIFYSKIKNAETLNNSFTQGDGDVN